MGTEAASQSPHDFPLVIHHQDGGTSLTHRLHFPFLIFLFAERHLHKDDQPAAITQFCPDASTMRLDQALADGQSQARAHWIPPRVLPVYDTVKLIEDALEVSRRNTGTAISNANDHMFAIKLRAHIDGRFRGRVAHSVLNEVCQDLIHLQIVQFDQEQVIRQMSVYDAIFQKRLEAHQYISNESCEGMLLFLGYECALLDARHVEEVAHQVVQAIRLAVNMKREAAPCLFIPLHVLLEERTGGSVHPVPRRTQALCGRRTECRA